MGQLFGIRDGNCIHIMDALALPVEGTETRVNASDEAHEFIACFLDANEKVYILFNTKNQTGKKMFGVGWYHSHPDYGPFLSKIDIGT